MPPTLSRTNDGEENRMEDDTLEPLAIIGFALKFPQDADSPEGFWRVMEEKRCVMTEWPEDRFHLDAFFHRDSSQVNKTFVPGAHFLKQQLGVFDAPFFGINAAEAMSMDPQHRILLETTYHALEDAGIPMERAYGTKTGVYTGSMTDDYKQILTRDIDDVPKYAATGGSTNMIANRVSWFYSFLGPSLNIDSACSSSLMAFDLACQGLRNKDCNMAVVAGSSIFTSPEILISLINMSFLSPHGRCHSFDQRADGYSRGEGIGVVLLKRLGDAIRDGDVVRAVVRSTGSNQDGHTPGVTQPSKEAQAALIRDTYSKAGLTLSETRFFEAHGTGTPIGDPIEAEAIGCTFRTARSEDDPLYIGAAKSNIGHLEGGSGLAGIIKAIMVLEKGIIPPNANFSRINPKIDVAFLNIKFPTRCVPWPSTGLRRASVASFGFGGSNSHAVLDDAYNYMRSRGLKGAHHTSASPPNITTTPLECFNHDVPSEARGSTVKLLVFSAADEEGVQRLVDTYEAYFARNQGLEGSNAYLDHLAYTLSSRRSRLSWKSFALVGSVQGLKSLRDLAPKPIWSDSQHPGIAFIFTGQGAQYRSMGLELLSHPIFEASIKQFDGHLLQLGCKWTVTDLLRQEEFNDFDEPEYSQPMTTALQIALHELLEAVNIRPTIVMGHSSGEIAAAYAAGALSMSSACKVSYYRGQCASALKNSLVRAGAMLSVDLAVAGAREFLRCHKQYLAIHIACINSPYNVTLSGDEDAIDSIMVTLETENFRARKLRTGVAYHSPHMAQAAKEYEESIRHLERSSAATKRPLMISSVTGQLVQRLDDICTAEYWVTNLVSPVEFSTAMETISSYVEKKKYRKLGAPKLEGIQDIVEVGPHSALRRPILDCLQHKIPHANVRYHSTLSRDRPARQTFLELLGLLYSYGYQVDIPKANETGQDPLSAEHVLVDLPSYPFNHSKLYWHESPLSKHSRLRRAPRHELLGVPVPEWNPLEPRWRKFFDVVETPWIDDHRVNGRAIYPATGMIVMAIEGSKQVADPSQQLSGYQLSDVVFSAPIFVSEEGRAEVQLHMRVEQSSSDKDLSSFEFRIYSHTNGEWVRNCQGFIQIQYTNGHAPAGGKGNIFYSQRYEEALRACTRRVSTDKMYENFVSNGLGYGPAFQGLDDMRWDGGNRAMGTLKCFRWLPEQSRHDRQQHVAHPTTLDAAGQLSWVALTRGAKDVMRNGLAVTRIRKAWIASSGLSYPDSDYLRAACTASFKGLRGTDSSIFALDSAGNLKMLIAHLETTAVGGDEQLLTTNITKQICFEMSYKPDVDLLSTGQLAMLTRTGVENRTEPIAFYEDLEVTLFHLATKALKDIDSFSPQTSGMKPHMAQYVEWLRLQVQERDASRPENENNESADSLQALIERVDDADGELLVLVARHLSPIVRGLSDPLELIFQSGHAERYYEALCSKMACCEQLGNYLDALSYKRPHLTILEIGAGTGSFTEHVLDALNTRPLSLSRYDYTDISEAFFERARTKFATYANKLAYKKLDIEKDPSSQGYEAESYDIVVAALVLHATSNLAVTVRNVRRLLKPHGKLILLEITEPTKFRTGVAFGTLPGWWLSTEKERRWSPCVSEGQWRKLLGANGFQRIDTVLRDYENDVCHESSIFIATADGSVAPADAATDMTVLIDPQSSLQTAVSEGLRACLAEQYSLTCQVLSIEGLTSSRLASRSTLIFLVELDAPYLSKLDQASFEMLQDALGRAIDVIWVTSAHKTTAFWADLQMVRGFSRVLNTEKPSRAFVTLSLEDHGPEPSAYIPYVCQATLATIIAKQSDICELEYVEADGALLINRVLESPELNQEVQSKTHTMLRHQQLGLSPPLALTIANPGILDSLRFEEDKRYYTDLGPDEVEIKVQAVGINFRDLFTILGKLDSKDVGCDCAGIVTKVGANTCSVQVGDRVCAPVIGCCNTYTRCNSQLAVKVPDAISLAEAAALPVTGVTAHYSLYTLARLQKGESILIHCAAGGTGQMMLQIAQLIGAEIYVTVGTEEKRQLIKNVYGIPETRIFYSRDTSFADDIYRTTNGKGVDVVVNSLSGRALLASWECIAPCGRFIELGKSDIRDNTKLPMIGFEKNVAFFAVATDYLSQARPRIVGDALRAIIDMVADNRMRPALPLHLFPVSRMGEAFRLMQSGKNVGKMVLTFDSSDLVPTWLTTKHSSVFDPGATYLIAGGFGGLGRSAARWMAQRGARNIILLSRSGPVSAAATALLEELWSMGVRTCAPKCDVSSSNALAAALAECSGMPPIRGCLQATMVLQDAMFETMSWEQWSVTIRSKVASSWNLHSQLPRNLSFFTMLSSITGIMGSMGQSNYAAGNTYQDALAAHRIALGERATSIDLGWMGNLGIGGVETDLLKGKKEVVELVEISEAEFLALLDRYCNSDLVVTVPIAERAQPIVGLVSPATVRAAGLEPPDWLLERPLLSGLARDGADEDVGQASTGHDGAASGRDLAREFAQALSIDEAAHIIAEALVLKLSRATSIAPDDIDPKRPLHVHGVDSLLAVELRNWFSKLFKADVAIFDITGQSSLEKIAEKAARQSGVFCEDRDRSGGDGHQG